MKLIVEQCGPLRGDIFVSGDKSITHRSLIIGAIADGGSVLKGYSKSADCVSTMRCLVRLNIPIDISETAIVVHGKGLHGLAEPSDILDCGNSSTTMRLLSGLVSGKEFFSVLSGDKTLRDRPMGSIIEPLRLMGAEIIARKREYAPLAIKGGHLKGIHYSIPVASSQVKSSILLAGLYAEDAVSFEEPVQTRDHTERLLSYFDVDIENDGSRISLSQAERLEAREISIPGDISSAAFFLVLGSIAKDAFITLKNVGINPTRTGILDVLKLMGANISEVKNRVVANEPVADLVVASSELKGVNISGEMIPRIIDELPVLAVAATQAQGRTVVRDISDLRLKETGRIGAIVEGLKKMGGNIEETDDGFVVEGPSKLLGFPCSPAGYHRIAMALMVAGMIASGQTVIYNAECIHISYPEFITLMDTVSGEEHITVKK
jgi:3-phosphoshikimate 1-carboxyvinyltransferase